MAQVSALPAPEACDASAMRLEAQDKTGAGDSTGGSLDSEPVLREAHPLGDNDNGMRVGNPNYGKGDLFEITGFLEPKIPTEVYDDFRYTSIDFWFKKNGTTPDKRSAFDQFQRMIDNYHLWLLVRTPRTNEAYVGFQEQFLTQQLVWYYRSANITNVRIVEDPVFGEWSATSGDIHDNWWKFGLRLRITVRYFACQDEAVLRQKLIESEDSTRRVIADLVGSG